MFGTGRRRRTPWRARRALRAAQLLDRVVDSQLPVVAALPETTRWHSADYLAELVMLAQAYRHYAAGWIDRRTLDERARATVARLDQLRRSRPAASPPEQLTEQD
ncbi:hypothetical protein [Longimycelium tulufanense]|uniref:hypothetical protein n=1 Tax=Longimycelium tulufanense TaxID=907463 RepID=UPI0016656184|nr:hypothetical protein [Longimycelium tulufanense]